VGWVPYGCAGSAAYASTAAICPTANDAASNDGYASVNATNDNDVANYRKIFSYYYKKIYNNGR
jgi:hypothetical protein